jgi:anti-anti-sigma factor
MSTRRPLHYRLFDAQRVGGALVVRLIGPSILKETELEQISQQFGELIARGERRVALDMGALTAMTSGLLTRLLTFQSSLKATGGRLALFGVPPPIYEIFQITHLAGRFHIYPAEFEALGSY